ncbi:extracellular solute-binding protein [Streptomyces aculeolatus]
MAAMTRRAFNGSALGAGVATALSGPLLSGCSDSAGSGGGAGQASGDVLPRHIAFAAVKPDYPALGNGTPAGFTSYPSDPKVAYKGKPGDGEAVTGIAQLNGPVPPSLEDNQYWQELNKRAGSPLQIQSVTAGTDFVAKITALQASGDLPDLMQLSSAIPSLGEFVQAKMVDLAEYLAGDKVKKYPFLANIAPEFWRACVYNGRLAGIPIPRGAGSSRVMLYRADLLDKAGIKDPEVGSFEDFGDLLAEVTSARSNQWGLAANPLDYIRQMFSIPNNFSQNNDGSFVSAYEHERQKDALEAARKLQQKGVINPDVAGAQPPQRDQWFKAGEGVVNWSPYTGWPGSVGSTAGLDPDMRIGVLPMPGFDGGRGRGWVGSLTNNMVSIPTSSQDRIETLLAVVDWLSAPFGTSEYLFQRYGIEGVHYELDGANPKAVSGKAEELPIGVVYLGSGPFVLYGPEDSTFVPAAHESLSGYMRNAVVDPTNLYYSPAYGSNGGRLLSTMVAVELDIVYGRKPVSAWDAAVREYLDGGGTQIKTELAAAAKDA